MIGSSMKSISNDFIKINHKEIPSWNIDGFSEVTVKINPGQWHETLGSCCT